MDPLRTLRSAFHSPRAHPGKENVNRAVGTLSAAVAAVAEEDVSTVPLLTLRNASLPRHRGRQNANHVGGTQNVRAVRAAAAGASTALLQTLHSASVLPRRGGQNVRLAT